LELVVICQRDSQARVVVDDVAQRREQGGVGLAD